MTNKTNKFWQRLIMWLAVCFCFAGIPSIIVFYSFNKYYSMSEEGLKAKIKGELQKALNDCAVAADKERFWCQKLSEKFQFFFKCQTPIKSIEKWLREAKKDYGEVFEFLIWDKEGQIVTKTFSSSYHEAEWHEVFIELAGASNRSTEITWTPKAKANISTVRKILGPQYIREMIESNTHPKLYGMAWTDSSLRKPIIWTYFTEKGGFLMLFDHKKMLSNASLKVIIKKIPTSKNFQWGLFEPGNQQNPVWLQKEGYKFINLQSNLRNCDRSLVNFVEEKNYYLATSFLTPQLRGFVCAKREFTKEQKRLKSLLPAFLLIVLMTPLFTYAFNTIVRGQPGTIAIRPRLAFLFFFANVIPFLAMTIVSQEYYLQKRSSLLKEVHKKSVELLKNYDKRLESTCGLFEYNVLNFFDSWAASIKNGKLDQESNQIVIETMKKALATSFFIVASGSTDVGSYSGVNKVKESLAIQEEKQRAPGASKQHSIANNDRSNSQIFNLIGKRIMNELNGISKTNQATTKLEIVAESLLQKSFAEITHSFIKAMGGISTWGFGKSQSLTLLKFISLSSPEIVDYMAVVLWNSKSIQQYYIETSIMNMNRNPIGLKVVIRRDDTHEYYPTNFISDKEIESFMDRAIDRPSEEIETIIFDGQEHLAICFRGAFLNRYKILGLYPIPKLNRTIGRQKRDLSMLGALSILLGLLLAQVLSRSFLNPIEQLKAAALAIEGQDFKHRVKDISKDEFGEIGTIFNHVMVGLEELEVAKVVQESLFPDNHLSIGQIKIFGKSDTMAELGGDYFDFFQIASTSCGILMGDVAGHGVGAALIMAMAKSGILGSEEYLEEPQQLLERLHDLIYSSKTRKQKKIMTFQYLSIDTITGQGKYSNAGACSPIFVENRGESAKEITLSGAALGAFKKSKLNEIEISFKPGDAMVFYTDGIIEARSPEGEEIGYTNFRTLVQKSWNQDPEVMYKRLLEAYEAHIDGQEAEDDLTLIVVVFQDQN